MKKILTIAATALLSTIAGAAHAAPVNITGDVTAACTIDSSVPGALTENAGKTALSTTTPAKVVVICNNGAKTLTLTNTAANNTIPAQPSTPTVTFGFVGGGTSTGVFAASTGATASLADPTGASGDTANITAAVAAADGKLLKPGTYTVVVDANITP